MNNLSTKKINTLTTNITSTDLTNGNRKKVRDYYILHTVLLIKIILIAVIMCYYLIKYKKTFISISKITNKFYFDSIN